jgi:hypothetical protein
MIRKVVLFGLLAVAAALAINPVITVYKSPTCTCCGRWVSHLKANGFTVKVVEGDYTKERTRLKVPTEVESCHTGEINGYFVEGHVPASEIKRLITTKPKAKGIAAPGMPIGSPGMETGPAEAYSVVLIDEKDKVTVYRSYPAAKSVK